MGLPKTSEILDRLKLFYGYTTDVQLARRLGFTEGSAIGNWRRRNSLDIFVIAKHCPEIDLDWMLWGRGSTTPILSDSPSASPPNLENNLADLEKYGLPRNKIVTIVTEALENYLQTEKKKQR